MSATLTFGDQATGGAQRKRKSKSDTPNALRRPPSRAVYARKRAVTACLTCRSRKKKCDNQRPSCGFCKQGGGDCRYSVNETSVYDSASLAILDRLSNIEQILKSERRHSPLPGDSRLLTAAEPSLASIELQDASSKISNSPTCLESDLPLLSKVRTDTVLAWPVLEDAFSGLRKYYFLDGEGNRKYTFLNNPSFDCPTPMEETQQLQTSNKSPRYSTDKEDVDRLVDQFFLYTHTKNPILDRAVIKRYCAALYEDGVMWDLPTCVVLLVCALGVVAHPWQYRSSSRNEENQTSALRFQSLDLANCYYNAAEKRLGLAMRISGTLSVQCLCLAGMFCMYTLESSGALNMFHGAGTVLQTVLSTRLPGTESALSSEEQDITSRLYWTCFKPEREILAELPIGHLAITHLELSEQYPSPPSLETDQTMDSQWLQTEEHSWYYYLSEIALRRIADKIVLALLSSSESWDFHDSGYPIQQLILPALELERQLFSWHESLPRSMAFPEEPIPLESELAYFLRSRYYLILELLHRPFLCYVIHNVELRTPELMQLAERCLMYAFHYLMQSNHTHRHHGKWLQLRREVTATSLLFAASGCGITMPTDWYIGVERAECHLQYWSMEAPFLPSWEKVVSALKNYFFQYHVPDSHQNAVGAHGGS